MAEIDYARSLARWGKETFTIRPTVVVSARVNLQEKKKPRGMMEMKDITAGIFVNIIVEVKINSSQFKLFLTQILGHSHSRLSIWELAR